MKTYIRMGMTVLLILTLFPISVCAATVEYDNLRQLVTEGNPELLKTEESYDRDIAFYEQTIRELQDEKDSLLLMEEHTSDPNEKQQYRQNAKILASAISRMQKNWQRQTQVGGAQERSLENTIDTFEYTAQSRMAAYCQMRNSVSVLEKQAEAAKKTYEAEQVKHQTGASTQEKEDLAKNSWLQKQNSLESARAKAKDLRFQLLSYLGISDTEDVTIGTIPEPELSQIDALDWEADLEKAVNNNSAVKNIRHSSAKTASARENKEARETEAVGNQTAAFLDLYQQLLAARLEYQAAVDAYAEAEAAYHTLQLKKQAGMLSPSAYLNGEADYLNARAKKENAGMTLWQQYQNYQTNVR